LEGRWNNKMEDMRMTIEQLKHYIDETRCWSIQALENGDIARYEFLSEIVYKRSSELYKMELREYIASI